LQGFRFGADAAGAEGCLRAGVPWQVFGRASFHSWPPRTRQRVTDDAEAKRGQGVGSGESGEAAGQRANAYQRPTWIACREPDASSRFPLGGHSTTVSPSKMILDAAIFGKCPVYQNVEASPLEIFRELTTALLRWATRRSFGLKADKGPLLWVSPVAKETGARFVTSEYGRRSG